MARGTRSRYLFSALLVVLSGVALLVFVAALARPVGGDPPVAVTHSKARKPEASSMPSLTQYANSDEPLQTRLEAYLADLDGVYGFAIYDFVTGETVLVNSARSFKAASTYKLLVMYKVFEEVEAGRLSLDDTITILDSDAVEEYEPDGGFLPDETVTVYDALHAMITVSSNNCAHALVRELGGWSEIENAASALGMEDTGLDDSTFYTTPDDMLRFLVLLEKGELAGPDATAQMMGFLFAQQNNDRIPALLPDEAEVAHKTGELAGVRNDAGIVYSPCGRFAIAAFSEGIVELEATRVISEVSWIVYQTYGY